MSKKPFYDADNFEAMNVLLDQAQGFLHPLPKWAERAQYRLQRNPAEAFQKALAGIRVEVIKLLSIISRREALRIADEKKQLAHINQMEETI